MMKQRVLVMALLAISSSPVFAGGTVRQAPAEAEAAPAPVPAPLVTPAPAPVVIYQPTNYAGIGIGASKFRGDCVIDSNDTGYKIFAGHHLSPHFSVELSYVDLGRSNEDLSCLAARSGTGTAAGGNGGGGNGGGGNGGGGNGGGGNGGGGNGGGGNGGGGNGGGGNGGGGSGNGGGGSGSGTGSGSASGSGSSSGTGTGDNVSSSGGSNGSGSTSVGAGGSVSSSGSGGGSNTTSSSSGGSTGSSGSGNSGGNGGSGSGGSSNPASIPGSSLMTSLDPHVRGVGLALVAGMPFYNNAASVYVKGGAFFYHASDDLGGSNNGTSPFYGIGAQYNFGLHHAVRAEYERYHNVGTDAAGKQNVDLASISYVYRF